MHTIHLWSAVCTLKLYKISSCVQNLEWAIKIQRRLQKYNYLKETGNKLLNSQIGMTCQN